MKFIPFKNKVEISLVKTDGFLGQDNISNCGVVISVGEGVKFCKKGDTIYFREYGLDKVKDKDEVEHFFVEISEEFILGKHAK